MVVGHEMSSVDHIDWASGPQHQLWIGNVPVGMAEKDAIAFLAQQVPSIAPPYKIVLRDGGQGQACGVASWRFRSARWAFKDADIVWPNGMMCLFRCTLSQPYLDMYIFMSLHES